MTGPGVSASLEVEVKNRSTVPAFILLATGLGQGVAAVMLFGAGQVTLLGAGAMGITAVLMLYWAKHAWPRPG